MGNFVPSLITQSPPTGNIKTYIHLANCSEHDAFRPPAAANTTMSMTNAQRERPKHAGLVTPVAA
jgi:hypothetical protein